MIDKKIRDNFKRWDSDATDVKVAGDPAITLRARLKQDYTSFLAGREPTKMGATYYRGFRELYGKENLAMQKFRVTDPSERRDPTLIKAMSHALRQRPERSKLSAWCQTHSELQDVECVGLARFLWGLRPKCSKQLARGMDILDCMARADAGKNHADIMGTLFPKNDAIICQALLRSRSQKIPDKEFLEKHAEILVLLFGEEHVEKVMTTADWSTIPEVIGNLVGVGDIGLKLFSCGLETVLAQHVTKVMMS